MFFFKFFAYILTSYVAESVIFYMFILHNLYKFARMVYVIHSVPRVHVFGTHRKRWENEDVI